MSNLKSSTVLKSAAVLTALLAGACAAPETRAPAIAFYDPAVPVYAAHCRDGTFTGHGIGYQNCIDRGLEREALARASGTHDAVYTAALQ